jgi:hypothetical protein
MGCFLSVAKGEPIMVQSWFTAHCPKPFRDFRLAMVASSKQRDTNKRQRRLERASTRLEKQLKDVTARPNRNLEYTL